LPAVKFLREKYIGTLNNVNRFFGDFGVTHVTEAFAYVMCRYKPYKKQTVGWVPNEVRLRQIPLGT